MLPFPQSYWLSADKLIFGHYPSSPIPEDRERKLQGLLDCGIKTIINLTLETELNVDGNPLDDYAQWMASHAHRVICIRQGFVNETAPDIETMTKILHEIEMSLLHDCPVYVHCYGGHGRSGTVAACHLISTERLSPGLAIERVLALREPLPKNHYPFEADQINFIHAWADHAKKLVKEVSC